MLQITAKKAGFRRCGIAHPATITIYPNDKFTPAQLSVLKTEPMLVVVELPDPETESDNADVKPKTKK